MKRKKVNAYSPRGTYRFQVFDGAKEILKDKIITYSSNMAAKIAFKRVGLNPSVKSMKNNDNWYYYKGKSVRLS